MNKTLTRRYNADGLPRIVHILDRLHRCVLGHAPHPNPPQRSILPFCAPVFAVVQFPFPLFARGAWFRPLALLLCLSAPVAAQDFEQAHIGVGNVGMTITNSGFVGNANARRSPVEPPSFEYPLDSGIEHLFEAGLWLGAIRSDGRVTVRTGSITSGAGYQPGADGFEFAPTGTIFERSTLPESPAFTRQAVSHQDFIASFADTMAVLPGTSIPMPDVTGRLGMAVTMRTHAWNFPFADSFVILHFEVVNISSEAWDSVYVGLWHDSIARNVNTTTDTGSNFFNKGGYGSIDSLMASYVFNAGGTEESLNTYAAVVILGADWQDPSTGLRRLVAPSLASEFVGDGYSAPGYQPRWWSFGSNPEPELARPGADEERFRRMATPYPDPSTYSDQASYESARKAWYDRLRTDGQLALGNWISLSALGPIDRVEAGDTLNVWFAFVAALKPEAFQGLPSRPVDTPESRSLLVENIRWARRTFSGEDNNYNGRLDGFEDVNGNGRLDRYVVPEPPSAPRTRPVLEEGRVVLYWDASAERSRDPVTGVRDFEGYRIYRSNPGDDRYGDFVNRATLVAQYDRTGNRTGYNNGFNEIRLAEPVRFEGDTTAYVYRFTSDDLLSGWQYVFAVTAFDEGDPTVGLPSFESSRLAAVTRVFPGTPPVADGDRKVGVYPNPYRVNAAWDGGTSKTRRLNFYNLPPRCEIRVYTLAGEIVAQMEHDAASYRGDTRWYDDFGGRDRLLPGGEHSWDLLSESGLSLSTGLYLFSVKDVDSGAIQTGKFALIK